MASDGPNTPPSPPQDTYERIVADAMREYYGKTPRKWQEEAIVHILKMDRASPSSQPSAVFLARPTGGGKSLVRDTIAVCCRGVTLCISPLLSLSADQENNLSETAEKTSTAHPSLAAYHLDEISDFPDRVASLSQLLVDMESDDPQESIVLFASPQALLRDCWKRLVLNLIHRQLLSLVCVDEAHLFASFGLSFRNEFYTIRSILFDCIVIRRRVFSEEERTEMGLPSTSGPLSLAHCTQCPVLFMTASATKTIVSQLMLLTGLFIDSARHVLWPPGNEMSRREVSFYVHYSIHPAKEFKAMAEPLLKVDDATKAIFYTNSFVSSERHFVSINDWLDSTGYPGDTVLVNGSLLKEEKFHRVRLFTSPPSDKTMRLPEPTEPFVDEPPSQHEEPAVNDGDDSGTSPDDLGDTRTIIFSPGES